MTCEHSQCWLPTLSNLSARTRCSAAVYVASALCACMRVCVRMFDYLYVNMYLSNL